MEVRPSVRALRLIFLLALPALLVCPGTMGLLPPTPSHAAGGPSISSVTHGRGSFATYGLIELHVSLAARYRNPFDPSQIDLNAVFRAPNGTQYRVNGFYDQGFSGDNALGGPLPIRASGPPGWRIRFVAPTPGTWSYTVYVRDSTRRLASSSMGSPIRVVPGTSAGYVRVSRHDPHYLAFDNGTSYFPVGENLAFWYHGLRDYTYWLMAPGKLGGSGANVIRLWMAPEKDSIDYSYPLGDYTSSQRYAWALDQILRLAGRNNIKVILTLVLHADLEIRPDWPWDWRHSPYNTSRGGPAQTPCDFFSNPTAIAMFERSLRYVVARWGYSTSILSWELVSETDLVQSYRSCRDGVLRWHRMMIDRLHALDPAHHLITTSFAHMPGDPRIWSLPGLNIVQSNHYSPGIPGFITSDLLSLRQYGKPAFMGEFGLSSKTPVPGSDISGWYIHLGEWAGLMAGGAGSGLNWYWQAYVDHYNTYWAYRAVPRFVAGLSLDRAGFQPSPPVVQSTTGGGAAQVYTLRGRTLSLVWVLHTGGPRLRGAVSIPAMSARPARVQWWDTVRGVPLKTVTVSPRGGSLQLPLPGSAPDYAARVRE